MVFLSIKSLPNLLFGCALPPRRSESPVCATDNKPYCALHLLGWFIGSRGFSSLERRPEFWVLQGGREGGGKDRGKEDMEIEGRIKWMLTWNVKT